MALPTLFGLQLETRLTIAPARATTASPTSFHVTVKPCQRNHVSKVEHTKQAGEGRMSETGTPTNSSFILYSNHFIGKPSSSSLFRLTPSRVAVLILAPPSRVVVPLLTPGGAPWRPPSRAGSWHTRYAVNFLYSFYFLMTPYLVSGEGEKFLAALYRY